MCQAPGPHGHTVLTSGQNGGSSMFASSLLKLMSLNTGCCFTPAAPSPLQPRRCLGFLVSNCKKQKWSQKAPRMRKKTQKISMIIKDRGTGEEERSI